jgi:hypothetical protein
MMGISRPALGSEDYPQIIVCPTTAFAYRFGPVAVRFRCLRIGALRTVCGLTHLPTGMTGSGRPTGPRSTASMAPARALAWSRYRLSTADVTPRVSWSIGQRRPGGSGRGKLLMDWTKLSSIATAAVLIAAPATVVTAVPGLCRLRGPRATPRLRAGLSGPSLPSTPASPTCLSRAAHSSGVQGMNFKVMCLRVVGIAAAAAIVFNPAVASADPPGPQDPHQPDMTKNYCPGGRFGFGKLGVCDGEKYSDGSYWHQWMTRYITGPQFYYDCVGGDEPLPGPPPPGGCAGSIARDQPPPPAPDQPPPPAS